MTAKTAPKVTLWEFFQQLGKTFMLPVALLSFCGIMLGIGSSLSSHDVITLIPVLGNPVLQAIFTWMSKIGSFAFSFLPVMFCIAIPLGLARENKGVAAFAGFIGYAVMNLAVNFWLTNKGILPTTDAAVLKQSKKTGGEKSLAAAASRSRHQNTGEICIFLRTFILSRHYRHVL